MANSWKSPLFFIFSQNILFLFFKSITVFFSQYNKKNLNSFLSISLGDWFFLFFFEEENLYYLRKRVQSIISTKKVTTDFHDLFNL